MNDYFLNFFRNLEWDDGFSWFEGLYVSGEGEELVFYISSSGSEDMLPIKEALRFFAELGKIIHRPVREIADKYYSAYCRDWAIGEPVSKTVFIDSLRLSVVAYDSADEKRLTFSAGDFFGNHGFCVYVSDGVTIRGVVLEG